MVDVKNIPVVYELDGTELVLIEKNGVACKIALPLLLSYTVGSFSPTPTAFTDTPDVNEIELNWTCIADEFVVEKSLDNVSFYEIYRDTAITYTDTILEPDNRYFYRVKSLTTGMYESPYVYLTADTLPAP